MSVSIGVAEPNDSMVRVFSLVEKAHADLAAFWTNPRGWASDEVAGLFARCRLDRQLQLARCLRMWAEDGEREDREGRLILARANLGALVEGALQLGLTVFHDDYVNSVHAPRKKGDVLDAPDLMLQPLRTFFRDVFWLPHEAARWDEWVQRVQERRNAIHALPEREFGTHAEFLDDVRTYLSFLRAINDRFPYP